MHHLSVLYLHAVQEHFINGEIDGLQRIAADGSGPPNHHFAHGVKIEKTIGVRDFEQFLEVR